MAITEFISKGYNKLALRNIQQVHMLPKSKLQMILGTNGSGKSSLMEELSPLLSNHSDYASGGFKKITQERRGSIYTCTSDFTGPKNHYEIVKDGVEIYAGHSSTAYAAHIKNEFGLTPDIHAVRIGTKRFCRMSKDNRREWFTNMSPEDYGYAIKYYKRLTAATRDITGAINRINIRLHNEKEKLIDAQTEQVYRVEIADLNKTKAEMMQYWRPMEVTVDQALSNVSDIDVKLKELTSKFDESIKAFCNSKGYKSQQDIWDDIAKVQAEEAVIASQLSDIHSLIDANVRLIEEAMAAVGKDEASLKAQIADISRKLLSLNMSLNTDLWLDNGQEALLSYDAVIPELLPMMDMLVEDPQLSFTKVAHKENSDKLDKINAVIHLNEKEIIRLGSVIEMFEHRAQTDHTQCPKCDHTWIRGYDEGAHNRAKAERDKLAQDNEGVKKSAEALHELLETSSYQLQLLNQISLLARSNPVLMPMWNSLSLTNLLRTNPKEAVEYVRSVRTQLEMSIEFKKLKEEKADLELSLTTATSLSGINCKELQEKNEVLESKLYALQDRSWSLGISLTGYRKAQKAMEFQERFIPETEDLLAKRSDWISKAEVANHHSAVTAVMMHLEEEIAQRERVLSQIESQHRLISVLENEVAESKAKEKLMKKAMEALSPSAGLIARGLTGFINHFIAQMNAVIEKVWLYPLVISPVVVTDANGVDLDYKFAYSVDDRSAGKDVEDGSGAQQEIFDLAFMLVSMVHLGLDDSEIFLDEFSIKMDYAHRREAMRMVMELVNSSNFSQIFMISHYESSYGTLSDADITVLCPDNIQLPADLKYNTSTKIEK